MFFQKRASAQRFHDSAEREIVVRHVRARRRLARRGARRVIVRQRHYLQRRHCSRPHEFLKLLHPDIDAGLIRDVQIPPRVRRVGVADQRLLCGGGLYRRSSRGWIVGFLNELAVVPVGDARPARPDSTDSRSMAPRRPRRESVAVGSLVVVGAPATRVVRRHRFLEIIGGVRRRRPVVPVGADLGVHEKSIEEAEPLGERVMVRRDLARKEQSDVSPLAFVISPSTWS